ncbi:MAG: hypothetical protein BRD45_06135 [Bacteroidetes bacterium QS_8_64_10]|nr:MAG: hypothetical protein BRD45_06135 [Bacteroidetes bacterium QS_8_64_10]
MELTNSVAESDIEVYNLEELWDERTVTEFDIEPFLHEGLMLREEEFRNHVKEYDWQQHEDEHVAVFCSTDAIVPTWAFMLIASKLDGVAHTVTHGREADVLRDYYVRALADEDWSHYEDDIVVVKGCGGEVVPTSAYLTATRKLQGVARKLMFGEPCSSVPLWRRSREQKQPQAEAAGVKKPDLPKPSQQ